MSLHGLTDAQLLRPQPLTRAERDQIDEALNVRDRLQAITDKFIAEYIAAGGDAETVRNYCSDMLGDDPVNEILKDVE